MGDGAADGLEETRRDFHRQMSWAGRRGTPALTPRQYRLFHVEEALDGPHLDDLGLTQ